LERELYDLDSDPYELHNIVKDVPLALVEALEAKIQRLIKCEGQSCREEHATTGLEDLVSCFTVDPLKLTVVPETTDKFPLERSGNSSASKPQHAPKIVFGCFCLFGWLVGFLGLFVVLLL
jgi:hypothetical protein